MTPNAEWKKMAASAIAAVVFSAICLISFFTIDGMNGGFALAFVSFFLAVSSIVVALLFFTRARVMDAILADPTPLARWNYPEAMVQETIEREYQEFRGRNHAMFIVIGGMLGLVALFFILFMGEGGLETGLVLLAIAVLLFAVSRVTPWLEWRRVMNAPHEAIITQEGVVYEGAVYPFRSFLVFWHGVTFREAGKKSPAALVFSFTQLVCRVVIQPFDVVVPVPVGEEDRAGRVVGELGGDVSEQ
jgi:hypothetical protein